MRLSVVTAALVGISGASAFLSPCPASRPNTIMMAQESSSRKDFLQALGLGLASATAITSFPALSFADDEGPLKIELPPVPTNFDLTKEYYSDAVKMASHMKYATFMNRDTPNYENIAKSVKSEMIEFVSYYRRFGNIAGKPSFSTLYTAINVMAGHYASYGPKFPIPEKRRKRLLQEISEVERNIKRQR